MSALPVSASSMICLRLRRSASDPPNGASKMRGSVPNSTVSAKGVASPVCW